MKQSDQNNKIAANIRKYGWHCLHVFPTKDDGQQPFTYSIGFSRSYDAPEILVFGLNQEKAASVLNSCAHLLRSGHQFVPGVADDSVLSGGYKVLFRSLKIDHYGEYLGTAIRFYGTTKFNALVMFLPDSKHLFPWENAYSGAPANEAMAIVD